MKNSFTLIILFLLPIAAMPQRVIYDNTDSTKIEDILHRVSFRSTQDINGLLISIAQEFIGEKYVGGTLEQGIEEPLFISCTQLDCTTFVELVLAITKTAAEGNTGFSDVCTNLEKIRYRNGKNDGYTSRLHYISWWITDPAKSNILKDITPQISSDKLPLSLNFMSTHPGNYPLLADNPCMVKEIESLEMPYRGIETAYIPKEKLNNKETDLINTGDIIAITTSIAGLDVSHIGFAYYNNGILCLLHASSERGEVILDNRPLCEYLAKKKRHNGIRVFRAVF